MDSEKKKHVVDKKGQLDVVVATQSTYSGNSNMFDVLAVEEVDPLRSSLQELLECHVCANFIYSPIHQCRNGHTLCTTCETKVCNKCPTCRLEFGGIRNLALEKLAELLKLPCKYKSSGCQEIISYNSKPKHELKCVFRPYNCPSCNCSEIGYIPFLVNHLTMDHYVQKHKCCAITRQFNRLDKTHGTNNMIWYPTVLHCFDHYFCLQFESCLLNLVTPVYMSFVHFMGEEYDAQKYFYSLEVGAKGRKQIWEGTPRSIRDSQKNVRDSHEGLIIQQNVAHFLSSGNGKELDLVVKCRIWKARENSN